MNSQKQNVEIWCDALESGRFEQGVGRLCRREKYCCLGVACEIAIELGLPVEKQVISKSVIITCYDKEAAVLPQSVREFYGFLNAEGRFAVSRSLVDLNDEGITFKEIAKIIRKELADPKTIMFQFTG